MPRELSVSTTIPSLTHNPNIRLGADKAGNYVPTGPVVTEAILFGAVQNFLKILKDATGIDLDGGAWLRDLPTFSEWLASLKVKAENIFGRPNPNLFSWLPLEAMSRRGTNYLNNPLFDSPECLIDADRWKWDGTISYPEDEINGAAKGSVYIDANGDANDLCSNPVDVEEDQEVNCSIMTRWGNGFVATGNPISLVVEGLYVFEDQAIVMDEQELEAIQSPGAIGSWEELSGTYVVPPGCNAVRLVLHVGGTATTGQVWFAYGGLYKKVSKGLFGLDIVSGLKTALANLDNFVQDLVGFIGWAIDGIFHPFSFLKDIGELISSWFDDTEVTAGEANDAKQNAQDLIDHAVRAWLGTDSFVGGLISDARDAMDKLFGDVAYTAQEIKAMQARDSGDQAVGKVISIDFTDYGDGPIPPSLFRIQYIGGNSRLVIKNGKAQWDKLFNTNCDAKLVYAGDPMDTDFMIAHGTMGSAPEDETDGGRPHFYAILRANNLGNAVDYVWARGWSVGSFFQYKGDIGYAINGVEYTWQSGVSLTWSMSMSFVAGVGNNPRQYQVFSGGKLVTTYTEAIGEVANYASLPTGLTMANKDQAWVNLADGRVYKWSGTAFPPNNGTAPLASKLGSGHRQWGSISQLRQDNSGVPNGPGSIVGCAVADNELPAVWGTQAMYYRTSSTGVLYRGGSNIEPLPANFFGFVGRASKDILTNPANGSFTVLRRGIYSVNCRIPLTATMSATCYLVVRVNGVVEQWGDFFYPNNGDPAISAHWTLNLKPGDVVDICTYHTGLNVTTLCGEATGTQCFLDIAGVSVEPLPLPEPIAA